MSDEVAVVRYELADLEADVHLGGLVLGSRTVGPLHLDLLGLIVDLNQVHLSITADPKRCGSRIPKNAEFKT
jgi:hypothetical protein